MSVPLNQIKNISLILFEWFTILMIYGGLFYMGLRILKFLLSIV